MSRRGFSSVATIVVISALALLLAARAATADVLYWDTAQSGVWDTDNYWATDNLGNGVTTWADSSDANFYADSTSVPSTITVLNPVNVNSITFTGGGYTVNGNTLNLISGNIVANQNAVINSPIQGSAGLTLSGGGQLTLGTTSTYSGPTRITGRHPANGRHYHAVCSPGQPCCTTISRD